MSNSSIWPEDSVGPYQMGPLTTRVDMKAMAKKGVPRILQSSNITGASLSYFLCLIQDTHLPLCSQCILQPRLTVLVPAEKR